MDVVAAGAPLPVGHPVRAATATALALTLGSAALFTVFALISTQDQALRAHSPWQDDPYDVVVSFTMFGVPLVAVAGLLRAQLCRADLPLACSRIVDLQRAAHAVLTAIVLTALSDWIAVAVGSHRSLWGSGGRLLIALLAAVSLAGLGAILASWRAHRRAAAAGVVTGRSDPDWCEDALELVALAGTLRGPLGSLTGRAGAWVGLHVIEGRWGLRRHSMIGALVAATGFGVALAVSRAIAEASGGAELGNALGLGLLTATIGGAGMFAVLVGAGSYLRIVRPRQTGRRSGRRPLMHASFAAACSVPLVVAFRDQLGSVVGHPAAGQPVARLALVILALAGVTWLVTFLATTFAERRSLP